MKRKLNKYWLLSGLVFIVAFIVKQTCGSEAQRIVYLLYFLFMGLFIYGLFWKSRQSKKEQIDAHTVNDEKKQSACCNKSKI